MIELCVLGGLDLRGPDAGRCSSIIAQPKRLALLAYLALARPRGFQQRDRVLALFWPEQDLAGARNALGQTLHFLRERLGADLILNRGRSELGLNTERFRCDVWDLEAALAANDGAGALDLYRGELLRAFFVAGLPELERWLEDERAYWRERVCAAAWDGVEALEAAGSFAAARTQAERGYALAPEDEAGLRRILALHERAGDIAGALRLYGEFAERLAARYELRPSAATQELVDQIRGRHEQARATDAPPPASIAVLPFLDMSAERAANYLGDGLAEDLITALASIPGLRVTSRTSSFTYRNRSATVRTIGQELSVATVLEGSVRCVAGRLRVTAQLIDTQTDTHLWAETYDRDLADVLAVQTEIAERIATALRGKLSAVDRQRVVARTAHNAEAFDLYLRGRWHSRRGTVADWWKSLEYFERALQVEPLYAYAHVALAETYMHRIIFDFRPPMPRVTAFARARIAARAALDLDDELGEAHAALALVLWYEWDWTGSERAFKRALALNPGYAPAHHQYGLSLTALGRFDEARVALLRAQALDPLSLDIMTHLAVVEMRQRRYDAGIVRLKTVLEINPDFEPARRHLAEAYAYSGQLEQAGEWFIRLGYATPEQLAELIRLNAAGDETAFHLLRARIFEEIGAALPILAAAVARAGDFDRAFDLLRRAVAEREPTLTDGVRVHPGNEIFYADPRWREILDAMGIE